MSEQLENGRKLFEYLEQLSLLNTNVRKNIKALSNGEERFDLEDASFLPELDKIFLKNRRSELNEESDLLLSIERYKIEEPPKLPKQLENWIEFEQIGFIQPEPKEFIYKTEKFNDDKKRIEAFEKLDEMSHISPTLKDWVTKDLDTGEYEKIEEKEIKIYFKDYPELKPLYENWLNSKWEIWREKNNKYNISNQAYDKFYALRSFLKTESDGYDLLWGHDILTRKQNGTEIYHPTLFTPVEIEFEPNRNIISIKLDINSKPYFDISFVREALNESNGRNLIEINALAERINKKISDDNFNIWDYEMVHKYLQQLVRYISPDGESKYKNRDIDLEVTSQPTSFNAHNLFLLKKSGKSWADYAKKIQEDIKKNKSLTPFLDDLICGDDKKTKKKDDDEKNEGTDKNNSEDTVFDGELYFPLPYNEEQKKIANQVEFDYGSVVQGPPGTGKTHTIANLISRFLAKGKTVLVTSQTGQALSVLKDKIPSEIRSMVVSQVEASSRNNDLQSAVSEINTTLSDKTKFTPEKEKQKQVELQKIREKIATKNKEFENKTLLDSKEDITIGIEKFTPIAAAKFCTKFESANQFKMLDDIEYGDELTISQHNINNYVSALKSSGSDVWDFVNLDKIPTIETLPTESNLNRFFELKNDLTKEELRLFKLYVPSNEDLEKLDNVEENINDYITHNEISSKFKKRLKEVDFFAKTNISETDFFNTKKDSVFNIHDSLERLKESLLSFNEPYEKELFEVLKNDNQKQKWQDILAKIKKLLKEYNDSDSILLGKKVMLVNEYDIDYISALEIISKIEEQAKNNGDKVKKGIGLLFNLDIKRFIKNTKIDGKELHDNSDIDVVKAYFSKEEIEDGLKNIWEQAFKDMENKKEFSTSFNIVEFEGFINGITRIVEFEKDNLKLKTKIQDYKLFKKVDIFDLSFVENAMTFFDNLLSCFKSIEYKNLINGAATDFEKDNAHQKTILLANSIKEMNIEKITSTKKQLEELNNRKELSEEYSKLYEEIYNNTIKKLKSNKNNHKEVISFLQNIETGNFTEIKSFYKQIPDLLDRQNKSEQIKIVEDRLNTKLQKTISGIKLAVKKDGDVEFDIEENWKWKRLISWLDKLHSGDSVSKISKDLHILKNKEMDLVKELVEISAWMHLKKRVTKKQKEALASFALSMRRYGMGGGKYAPKHLNDAKNSLKICGGAVPVWIMPVNTIHQLFPEPKAGMFDVVIFDEASQVDTRGLNVAYIGKKLLVVGDDEQVSPTTFTTQSKVTDLITRYISDVPNSHHFSNTSSLFDIAKIKMTDMITLTEHFRSVEEIIGFSNSLSYSGTLKILRDQLPKHRLDPILEPIFVENGFEETNGKENKPEAEKIVEKLKEMLKDNRYIETDEDGKTRPITFGVISLLGEDQQKYITKLISEEISSGEIEKRRIACGDSYTFQGDERDIIFLSMVKAPDLHNPKKTISPYSVNTKSNKQRINVAMSRAKNKMILFHSIPKDKLSNPNDLRKKILDWFYNHKTEKRKAGMQAIREEVDRGRASEFEYEVAEIIIKAGYEVIPQYEVAGYRIDLVIQGKSAKLAIECDGDKYHNKLEAWQEDIERQQIIERAGWTFWRVTGSAFYKHGAISLNSLWEKLEELGIKPSI